LDGYIKNNEMGGACGTYRGEERCIKCKGVLGKLEEKRLFGRPRHK
jgi:hypothetical protein